MQHEGVGDLLVTMVTKQEQLFLVVVEFHRSELSRLDEIISDVTREVGGASPTGGYVNREKQLHSLQVCDFGTAVRKQDTFICPKYHICVFNL